MSSSPPTHHRLMAVLLASTSTLAAGPAPTAKSPLIVPPPPDRPWSVGVGYAPMFNVDASFGDLGRFTNPIPPPATTALPVFGEYDDGFVRPDISGSTALTSNWAYENNAQYDSTAGGTINLSLTESLASAGIDDDADAHLGLEIFASREFGRFDSGASWGLRFGFAYRDIEANSAAPLRSEIRRTTDEFPLAGVIPPLAPYTGSFTGPGPLLGSAAARTTAVIPGGATVAGRREIEADLFSLDVGPWFAFPVHERVSLFAEAGFTLALADGDYRFASATTIPGVGVATTTGRAGETEFLPGLYAGLGVVVALDEQWDLYLTGRYQYLDDFTIRAGTSRAELSFDEAFTIGAGVRFRF